MLLCIYLFLKIIFSENTIFVISANILNLIFCKYYNHFFIISAITKIIKYAIYTFIFCVKNKIQFYRKYILQKLQFLQNVNMYFAENCKITKSCPSVKNRFCVIMQSWSLLLFYNCKN